MPSTTADEIEVQVLMFGMVCQSTGEKQTVLRLPRAARVADVLAALGERYGAAFVSQVMRTAAAKASHSVISVDGRVVRDMNAALAPGKDSATVEIILLSGHEGG